MASSGDKFVYFLAGGFIGATVALLYAPKLGEDTRKYLEDRYKDGAERLTQNATKGKELFAESSKEVAERVTETINKSKDVLEHQKEQITAAVSAGREAYEDEKRKVESVAGRKKKKRKSAS